MIVKTPLTKALLKKNAWHIAGRTFKELADLIHWPMPDNLLKNKGWVGQLLEIHLGINTNSEAGPDFADLGIELKTIPVNEHYEPLESTFVCSINQQKINNLIWETSLVYKKLSHVLWVPIEGCRQIPLAKRRVGLPFFWQPDTQFKAILKADWCYLMEKVILGQLANINAQEGNYLQIRPKAANAKSLCIGYNEEGEQIKTLPRGFYLRALATKLILQSSKR